MNLLQIFNNIQSHLLEDEKPSIYLCEIKDKGYLDDIPFCHIKNLQKIEQSPKHHPEGNVWIHTMMVVDTGAKYRHKAKDKIAFMWTLLLHDIGKISTTKLRKGRITSYDHDKVGEKEVLDFLSYFNVDSDFAYNVSKLVRYHMHLLFIYNNLPYGDIEGLLREVDINDIALVFLSDRLGRGGLSKKDEEKVVKQVKDFYDEYS